MKNLKKIGLSALAGSLAAISAHAVEMSVTGTSELSYTTGGDSAGSLTGNPFGSNTSVKFSGSGDVGFGTASMVRTLNDNNGDNAVTSQGEYVSAYTTLDMGDMGTVMWDAAGGAITGMRANRDKLPTAYEEVWHGVGGSGIITSGSSNVLGYKNAYGPISFNAAYNKGAGAGKRASGDGVNTGAGTTASSRDIYVQYDVAEVEGLSIGGGIHETDSTVVTAGSSNDQSSVLLHVNYATGPVSVGYRNNQSQASGAGTPGQNVEGYAVAFNVNDALSISLAKQDREFDITASGSATIGATATNVTEDSTAINASYTVGSASIRLSMGESDDTGGIAGNKDESTEINVVLAF
jgi:outer membrane protein OmpU